MKIFLSYKFADEEQNNLKEFIEKIDSALKKSKHTLLTTFNNQKEFEKNNATMRQIMDKALEYIDQSEIVLCIIKSLEKSEGQIFEIGYSIAKNKKLILAIQKGLKTRWIEHYAQERIEFSDLNDLYKKLERVK